MIPVLMLVKAGPERTCYMTGIASAHLLGMLVAERPDQSPTDGRHRAPAETGEGAADARLPALQAQSA